MNRETQNLPSLSAVHFRKNSLKYIRLNKGSEFKGGSEHARQDNGGTQIRAQLTKVDDSNLNQTNTCNQTKNLNVTLNFSAKTSSALVTHDSTEPIDRHGQNGLLIPRRKNRSYPMVLKRNHEGSNAVYFGHVVTKRVSHNSDVTETDDDDDYISISKEANSKHEFDIEPTLHINKSQHSVSTGRSCPTIVSDRNSHERIKDTQRQTNSDITNTKVLQEIVQVSMEHIEKEGCFKQPLELFRQHVLYPEKKEYRMPPLTPVPIYPNDRNEQTNINPCLPLLYSYRQCPNDLQVSPSELARAGFHSISTDNQRVGCRSCGIELNINDFNGNDPYIVHRQMSSTCPALYRERDPSTILKQETTPSLNVNETETDYSDLQRSELVTPNDNLPNANGTPQKDTINERNKPSDERNSIQIDSVQGATASFVSSASSASPATPASSASAASHPLINYPPRNPSHKSSESRQQSFRNWPGAAQDIDALEQAGFFFTGEDDIVRCFHCDNGLPEWDPSDDPWVEHARHSPDCPFLRSQRDEHFISNIQRRWAQIYTPKHPHRTQMSTRLESFHPSWPRDFVVQTPEQLAGAGFFYTGETDTVRCHYCDGGLREWEPNDDPWTEHARWFPFCKFVIKVKGLSFIETAALTEDNDSELDNNTAVTPTPTRAHTIVAYDGYWPCESGEYREDENMTHKESASDDKPIAVYNSCAYNVGTLHRDLTVIPEDSIQLESTSDEECSDRNKLLPSKTALENDDDTVVQIENEYLFGCEQIKRLAEKHKRLETYVNIPLSLYNIDCDLLAEAGFFYTGEKFVCFSCNFCIVDLPLDDPWMQHTFNSPGCDYVKSKKGQEYIHSVLSQLKEGKDGKHSKNHPDDAKSQTDLLVEKKYLDPPDLVPDITVSDAGDRKLTIKLEAPKKYESIVKKLLKQLCDTASHESKEGPTHKLMREWKETPECIRHLREFSLETRNQNHVHVYMVPDVMSRISSYHVWPHRNIRTGPLVEAGFTCKDPNKSTVECKSCGLELFASILNGTNPTQYHREKSPKCEFFNQTNSQSRHENRALTDQAPSPRGANQEAAHSRVQQSPGNNQQNKSSQAQAGKTSTANDASAQARRGSNDGNISIDDATATTNRQLTVNVSSLFSNNGAASFDSIVSERPTTEEVSDRTGVTVPNNNNMTLGGEAVRENKNIIPCAQGGDVPYPIRNPRFTEQHARRESFTHWPHRAAHDIVNLVNAGFFYTDNIPPVGSTELTEDEEAINLRDYPRLEGLYPYQNR